MDYNKVCLAGRKFVSNVKVCLEQEIMQFTVAWICTNCSFQKLFVWKE